MHIRAIRGTASGAGELRTAGRISLRLRPRLRKNVTPQGFRKLPESHPSADLRQLHCITLTGKSQSVVAQFQLMEPNIKTVGPALSLVLETLTRPQHKKIGLNQATELFSTFVPKLLDGMNRSSHHQAALEKPFLVMIAAFARNERPLAVMELLNVLHANSSTVSPRVLAKVALALATSPDHLEIAVELALAARSSLPLFKAKRLQSRILSLGVSKNRWDLVDKLIAPSDNLPITPKIVRCLAQRCRTTTDLHVLRTWVHKNMNYPTLQQQQIADISGPFGGLPAVKCAALCHAYVRAAFRLRRGIRREVVAWQTFASAVSAKVRVFPTTSRLLVLRLLRAGEVQQSRSVCEIATRCGWDLGTNTCVDVLLALSAQPSHQQAAIDVQAFWQDVCVPQSQKGTRAQRLLKAAHVAALGRLHTEPAQWATAANVSRMCPHEIGTVFRACAATGNLRGALVWWDVVKTSAPEKLRKQMACAVLSVISQAEELSNAMAVLSDVLVFGVQGDDRELASLHSAARFLVDRLGGFCQSSGLDNLSMSEVGEWIDQHFQPKSA